MISIASVLVTHFERKRVGKQKFLGLIQDLISISVWLHQLDIMYNNTECTKIWVKKHFHEQGGKFFRFSHQKWSVSNFLDYSSTVIPRILLKKGFVAMLIEVYLIYLCSEIFNKYWWCPKGNQRLTFTHVKTIVKKDLNFS